MNIGTPISTPPPGNVSAKPGTLLAHAQAWFAKYSGTDSTGWVQLAGAKDRNVLAQRGGIAFDGTATARGTATLTNQNIGTDAFSLAATVSVPTSNPSAVLPILALSSATDSFAGFSFTAYIYTDGSLRFTLYGSTASPFFTATISANLVATYGGKTVHIACTRSGATFLVYLNGYAALYATAANTLTDFSGSVTSTYLLVGGTFLSSAFSGKISCATFYNLALAQADVTEIYELNGGVPERFKFGSEVLLNSAAFSNHPTILAYPTFDTATSGGYHAAGTDTSQRLVRSRAIFAIKNTQQFRVSGTATVNSGSGNISLSLQDSSGGNVNYSSTFTVSATGSFSTILTGTNQDAGATSASMNIQTASVIDYTMSGMAIKQLGAVCHLNCDDGLGYQLADASTNKLHAVLTTSGVTHVIGKPASRVRFTTNTSGNQQMLGQQCLPANSRIRSWTIDTTGTPTVKLGNASAGAQFFAAAALTTGLNDIALLTRFCSTNNLWVNSTTTDTLQHTIEYELVD